MSPRHQIETPRKPGRPCLKGTFTLPFLHTNPAHADGGQQILRGLPGAYRRPKGPLLLGGAHDCEQDNLPTLRLPSLLFKSPPKDSKIRTRQAANNASDDVALRTNDRALQSNHEQIYSRYPTGAFLSPNSIYKSIIHLSWDQKPTAVEGGDGVKGPRPEHELSPYNLQARQPSRRLQCALRNHQARLLIIATPSLAKREYMFIICLPQRRFVLRLMPSFNGRSPRRGKKHYLVLHIS